MFLCPGVRHHQAKKDTAVYTAIKNKSRLYHLKKRDPYFPLFKQYVLWGLTYEMLSSISGYAIPHLASKFHNIFKSDPPTLPPLNQSGLNEVFLLIDGLWFGRWFVLMVYRQSGNLLILHVSIAGREVTSKISKDLMLVKDRGYRFTGIVSGRGIAMCRLFFNQI